jgi:hypothetical protein
VRCDRLQFVAPLSPNHNQRQSEFVELEKENNKMNKQIISKLKETVRIAAAVSLAVFLSAFYPASISSGNGQTQKTATASTSNAGPKEGIKVHGHWSLEIRNPDGSFVKRTEFENDLTSNGALAIMLELSRERSAGAWTVELVSNAWTNGTARIYEAGSNIPDNIPPGTGFANLALGVKGSAFLLYGEARAQSDGSITEVQTAHGICTKDISPSNCAPQVNPQSNSNLQLFTHAVLPNAQGIVAGQTVQVTVTITIS